MPDTDICFGVTPSEATKKPQAIHMKHLQGAECVFQEQAKSHNYTENLIVQ